MHNNTRIVNIISKAIKESDRTYFFENYTKQAFAVLRVLKKCGYIVVPVKPDEAAIEKAIDSIEYGRSHPAKHVKNIYYSVLKAISSK